MTSESHPVVRTHVYLCASCAGLVKLYEAYLILTCSRTLRTCTTDGTCAALLGSLYIALYFTRCILRLAIIKKELQDFQGLIFLLSCHDALCTNTYLFDTCILQLVMGLKLRQARVLSSLRLHEVFIFLSPTPTPSLSCSSFITAFLILSF